MKRLGLALLLVFAPVAACLAGDEWPEWRGKLGQGHADAVDVPTRWSETKNVAWRTVIPGLGWSTPVIRNGCAWVTTAIDTPSSPEVVKERQKTTKNKQPLTVSDFVSMRAVCVELKSGKILHNIEMLTERDPQMIHYMNSYATPTPVLEGDRLYCHFGTFGMACLDTKTGKVAWSNRDLKINHENGPGSSPVLWNDLLIVHCDGIDQQFIAAVDKNTGKVRWKTARTGQLNSNVQYRKSYATALIVKVDNADQVISPAADWVYGYDPATGKELWKMKYGQLGFSNASRPVAGHGLVYICTGYMKSQLLAIQPGAANREAKVVWRFSKQVPNVSSPILVGDELYFGSDGGIVTCVDAKTGAAVWTERLGKRYWSSPIFADGRLYFPDSKGVTTVVEPGRKFKELAQNKLEGTLYAAPVAVDGALMIRTDKALYQIRNAQPVAERTEALRVRSESE